MPRKKKHGLAVAIVLVIILSLGVGIATPLILSSNASHDKKTEKKNKNNDAEFLYEDRLAQSSDESNDEYTYDSNDEYTYDSNDDENYTYTSENDFYSGIFGVTFTNTDYDLINWANSNGLQYSFNQSKNELYCVAQDPLNQVLDNALDAAGEEFLKEHEFGIGDIRNIYDGMTDESNEGFLDSIVGGVLGYLGGVAQEKVDNAIDGGVKEGIKTASSDNNIYYSFALDDNNQVEAYCITELFNNRESLFDTFVEKFGTPIVNNNVYIWNGQVSGTPATFYMWIDVNSYDNYVWQLYVVKNTQ